MFAQLHAPLLLLPQELDSYLQKGWFRMGQTLFTTSFLSFSDHYYSAIWLRTDLGQYREQSTFTKLKKQNCLFRTEIGRAEITDSKKELFKKYRQSVPFEASDSLQQLLYGTNPGQVSIFNTWEINLYDGSKLIGTGFFDLGSDSAEGISSFYDPDYKKYSLGRYLIQLKIEYCKNSGLKYFYPGYFAPGYKAFNYKLEIGKEGLEFWSVVKRKWFPVIEFTQQDDLLRVMNQKLEILRSLLVSENIYTEKYHYEFFQANLVPEFSKYYLFDYPVFLYLPASSQESHKEIIVFDVRSNHYLFLICRTVWRSSDTEIKPGIFNEYLLKAERVIFSSDDSFSFFAKISRNILL